MHGWIQCRIGFGVQLVLVWGWFDARFVSVHNWFWCGVGFGVQLVLCMVCFSSHLVSVHCWFWCAVGFVCCGFCAQFVLLSNLF